MFVLLEDSWLYQLISVNIISVYHLMILFYEKLLVWTSWKSHPLPPSFPGLALFTLPIHFQVVFLPQKPKVSIPKTELQTVAAKSKPSPGKFQTFSRGMQKWWFRLQIAGFTFHFSDFTFNDFCHTAFRAPGVQDWKAPCFWKQKYTEGWMIWWINFMNSP